MVMMHGGVDLDSHANRIHLEMVAMKNLCLVMSLVDHTVEENQRFSFNKIKNMNEF